MSNIDDLVQALKARLDARLQECIVDRREVTIRVAASDLLEVARLLCDEGAFHFTEVIDVCGLDYLQYGRAEWDTESVSSTGFGRAVDRDALFGSGNDENRFDVVYHLLSVSNNQRLRIKVYAAGDPPTVPSVVDIWPAANWFEREAFDLFGILFDGHPDLRRILTDYGFVGHPFRKDFPLIGNVEVRYDPEKGRVVYQPVSIEPRVLVPKVIREDGRYNDGRSEEAGNA
ncbi:MAG: NADH-quinone oxidoreductase subunit C [Chromatiales bacterium]|nr:NADH-quinone oxidoreductase subunit C [Chromatiales bacterium]